MVMFLVAVAAAVVAELRELLRGRQRGEMEACLLAEDFVTF